MNYLTHYKEPYVTELRLLFLLLGPTGRSLKVNERDKHSLHIHKNIIKTKKKEPKEPKCLLSQLMEHTRFDIADCNESVVINQINSNQADLS